MCRVLIGEAKAYPPGQTDRGLVREPERDHEHAPRLVNTLRGEPAVAATTDRYDSVQGMADGRFGEWIVYSGAKVMTLRHP